MRKTLTAKMERARLLKGHYKTPPNSGPTGAFDYSGPWGRLAIIANNAEDPEANGWEHVSVSLASRTPIWREMCIIKDEFWEDEEVVFQLHVPSSDHINYHKFCLHMWRNINIEIPRPPDEFVGPKTEPPT